MARMRKKADLPTKTCPVCRRPFTWRKKWAASWPEIVYCSERCRRPSRPSRRPSAATAPIANGTPGVGRFGNN